MDMGYQVLAFHATIHVTFRIDHLDIARSQRTTQIVPRSSYLHHVPWNLGRTRIRRDGKVSMNSQSDVESGESGDRSGNRSTSSRTRSIGPLKLESDSSTESTTQPMRARNSTEFSSSSPSSSQDEIQEHLQVPSSILMNSNQPQQTQQPPKKRTLSIKPKDYVVHPNYGIGKFLGIKTEAQRKLVIVEYSDGFLSIPVREASILLPYKSGHATRIKDPALSSMHSTKQWQTAVRKAKLNVKQLAINLLALYAHREKVKRPKYNKDLAEYIQFCRDFPYEPTKDQLQCIRDVEQDMCQCDLPMDRLVCGDVGFGKTEVALRAVMVAVANGRQACVLAPTTVLSAQHFQSIQNRLVSFQDKVKVGLLNRFNTAQYRNEVLRGLKSGEIQVLIGTHAVLNEKVEFANLGLLVIDEESKFGVNDKETMKRFRSTIDVLTMSATPIPRTLYMGLSGIRPMSLIMTPPKQRLPIVSQVCKYDSLLIQAAIKRELHRDGQVFFVAPHIKDLAYLRAEIESLVPDARLLVAHGRRSDLEDIMIEFAEHKADILLCTPIIESGIDVPLSNTLIAYRSDAFGLSNLYQLRGRVGRSSVQSPAYLTFNGTFESLTKEAQLRLSAIMELDQLGSGFELAQRDLEIRGAGTLYGIQQSGTMDAVGFETYMSMLHTSFYRMKLILSIPFVKDPIIGVYSHQPPDLSMQALKVFGSKDRDAALVADDLMQIESLRAKWLAAVKSVQVQELPLSATRFLEYCSFKVICKTLGVSSVIRCAPKAVDSDLLLVSENPKEVWDAILQEGFDDANSSMAGSSSTLLSIQVANARSSFDKHCIILDKGILVKGLTVGRPPFAIVHELSRIFQPLYQAVQEMKALSNKFQLKASTKKPNKEPPRRE